LLIIVFTLLTIRYGVIYPFLKYNGFELQLSLFQFVLLNLSIILIAAGGYVINAYQDRKIDKENNPGQFTDEDKNCCKKMMSLYNYLTIFGVVSGGILSFSIGQFMFTGIFLLVAGLLWFYSTTYKFMPFVGNVIVAFLIALVPLMLVIFEIPLLTAKYRQFLIQNNVNFMPLFYFVGTFSVFAFLINLMREIVKDIEDLTGDNLYKKNTIPVYFGEKTAKIISILIGLTTAVLLIYIQTKYKLGQISFWYILTILVFPIVLVSVKLVFDNTPGNFKLSSNILKIIMLAGILYSVVFYLNLI
jgi:4-hydroxybenzoate polyprenyltransferase